MLSLSDVRIKYDGKYEACLNELIYKPPANRAEISVLDIDTIEKHLQTSIETISKPLTNSAEFSVELVRLEASRNKPPDLKVSDLD